MNQTMYVPVDLATVVEGKYNGPVSHRAQKGQLVLAFPMKMQTSSQLATCTLRLFNHSQLDLESSLGILTTCTQEHSTDRYTLQISKRMLLHVIEVRRPLFQTIPVHSTCTHTLQKISKRMNAAKIQESQILNTFDCFLSFGTVVTYLVDLHVPVDQTSRSISSILLLICNQICMYYLRCSHGRSS